MVDGEDVKPTLKSVSDLELVPFIELGEFRIAGSVMRERAITLKANLGLVDAKYLLDHQKEIPTEFRGKYLVFTGTLLRGPHGGLHVACLYWGGDHWGLGFDWIDGGWNDNNRLARCKSSAL